MKKGRARSPGAALRRFGFKETIRGAIILSFVAGAMIALQGIAYAASYPDATSRQQFATSLEAAPALGVLYGELKDFDSPTGYMVYRVTAVLALIASVWGVMVATKLLRGQEENGQWEMIVSSSTTARSATGHVLFGFLGSLLVASFITGFITILTGLAPDIQASFSFSLLLAASIFLPALFFAGVGFFASQLSVTRQRALFYAMGPLVIFFSIRAVANTIEDAYWLKHITPFGWADLLNPLRPDLWWIALFILFAAMFMSLAIYLAGKRDYAVGLFHESTEIKPRLGLLGSTWAFVLRQNAWLYIAWAAGIMATNLLLVSISSIAAEAAASSPGLEASLKKLGGSAESIQLAFIGMGTVFTVMFLLVMTAAMIGSIRSEEAKNYLDNILVQPIRRWTWLLQRLVIIALLALTISLVCAVIVSLITHAQHLTIDAGNVFLIAVASVGTIIFALGFGALLYGLWPRLATPGMYVLITWSFIIDIIQSIVTLNDIVVKSSLFHYVSFPLDKTPDWTAFTWLTALGIIMATSGLYFFSKRDIISE